MVEHDLQHIRPTSKPKTNAALGGPGFLDFEVTGKRFRKGWKPTRPLDLERETLLLWEELLGDALIHLQFQRVSLAVQSLKNLQTWIKDKRRGRRPASDAKAQQPTFHREGQTPRRGEKPHAYENGTATESTTNLSKSTASK